MRLKPLPCDPNGRASSRAPTTASGFHRFEMPRRIFPVFAKVLLASCLRRLPSRTPEAYARYAHVARGLRESRLAGERGDLGIDYTYLAKSVMSE